MKKVSKEKVKKGVRKKAVDTAGQEKNPPLFEKERVYVSSESSCKQWFYRKHSERTSSRRTK